MRTTITMYLLAIVSTVLGQVREDYQKVDVYVTEDGEVYPRRTVDSLRYYQAKFVALKKIRTTSDSVYYSLKYFDKKLVKDRYKKDGSFCGNEIRKSERDIRKILPYNAVHSIKVVSWQRNDSLYLVEGIPKTKRQIDFTKMFEVKALDKELEGMMLDILVNYDNRQGPMEISFCWEPRNAVVFLDKRKNVIGYIEICFACRQYSSDPEALTLGQFCQEKFDAIQGIMTAGGITYGMTFKPEE